MRALEFIKLQDQINEYSYIVIEGEFESEGYYTINQNLEIELDSFTLTIELVASAEFISSAYSYDYPQDATIDPSTFSIENLEIAVYSDDVEEELTVEQENWVYSSIENFIQI